MDGYIKLYRKMLTSAVFDNPCLLKTFVWCLLKASHTENDQMVGLQTVHVMPGQFIYGRLKAGAELSLNPSTAHKYMLCLKSLKMVDIKGNSKYSLVTVVNWAIYQSDEKKHDSNRDNNVTAKYQQRDTNNNVKNDKNDKNEEDNPLTPLELAIEDFKAFRKNIKKPMTDRAIELLYINLQKLAGDDEEMKIAIINQSIVNGWQGVFALREDYQSGKPKKFVYNDHCEDGDSL